MISLAIVARVSTSARHDDVAVDGSDERIKRFFSEFMSRIYLPSQILFMISLKPSWSKSIFS